jgi:probable HAF family extracellular repeat protein
MYRALLLAVLSLSVLLSTFAAAQDALYTFTRIDVPGAVVGTQAHGINDLGEIVGLFSDGQVHGFVTDGVTFTTIAISSSATGINNEGQIVGWFHDATRIRGFVTDGVAFTPLMSPALQRL